MMFCRFEQYLAMKVFTQFHSIIYQGPTVQTAYSSFAEHVRVVNGSNRCNGRVEVYHDGNWKRVCTSDLGKEEAGVVCREINCGTPVTETEVLYFGEAHDLVGVKTSCSGNESSISQCTIQEFKESCVDATIFCTSKSFNLVYLHMYYL